MKNLEHYTNLAEMFSYPSEKMKVQVDHWKHLIQIYDQELANDLKPFIEHIENTSLEFQQEYYVSTFYVQPLCCLEIGYVLLGEDFRRGQFLANLKAEHRKAGNDCGTELPDHLPVLLALLPKHADPDFAEELAFSLIIPAIHAMITGFRSDNNYYKSLLKILVVIMEKDFPFSGYEKFDLASRKRPIDHKAGIRTEQTKMQD